MNTPERTLSQTGYFSTRLFPDEDLLVYYCNFPLHCIFVKPQVIYRTQKTDFDLQPTSVIYTQIKACITDGTEGLKIKILWSKIIISSESINITANIADIMWFWILKQVLYYIQV